jgi:hypothetical protein
MLPAVDFYEHFINEESIAKASMPSLKPPRVDCAKLNAEPAP